MAVSAGDTSLRTTKKALYPVWIYIVHFVFSVLHKLKPPHDPGGRKTNEAITKIIGVSIFHSVEPESVLSNSILQNTKTFP